MFVFTFFIPETKGRSLEEMDIVFGAVQAEKRAADIQRAEAGVAHGPDCSSSDISEHVLNYPAQAKEACKQMESWRTFLRAARRAEVEAMVDVWVKMRVCAVRSL